MGLYYNSFGKDQILFGLRFFNCFFHEEICQRNTALIYFPKSVAILGAHFKKRVLSALG